MIEKKFENRDPGTLQNLDNEKSKKEWPVKQKERRVWCLGNQAKKVFVGRG